MLQYTRRIKMKKTITKLLAVVLLATLASQSLNADVSKGQRLYLKKLKYVCGFNGAKMAEKHTVTEWENIFKNGKLADEIKKECPKVKDSAIKEKFMQHYFDFFKEYGSDSGNIPAC